MDARRYSAGDTLKDGTPVTVRAIRREDAGTILQAFRGLDRELVYRRFFSPKKDLSPAERGVRASARGTRYAFYAFRTARPRMAEAGRTGTTLPHGACTTGWAAPPDLCRSVEQSAAARPQDWGLAGNESKYNTASENVLVDVTGALLTSEAIAKLNLWVDGRFYKLTDIAEIQHGYSDPATKMFRVNGKPAIGIGVNMRSGGNNLTFGESLHGAAERLTQRLPVGIDLKLVSRRRSSVSATSSRLT